jgi:23S rRNA-/tRNA-specific pseudouridylate synthase
VSAPPADFWTSLPLGREVVLLNHEAAGLIAFNKPAGILSHPNSSADEKRSLLTCRYDQVGEYFFWKTAEGAVRKLWLLNRLDGATSGVILGAANEELAAAVKRQLLQKKVTKVYVALVFGRPAEKHQVWRDLLAVTKKEGVVRTRSSAGNIPSVTDFQFLRHGQGAFSTSLIRLEPRTGRSHQLRVQCAKRHLPIVGDQTYGDFGLNRAFAKTIGSKRLFLHSQETRFDFEFGGRKQSFRAVAPLPAEFDAAY